MIMLNAKDKQIAVDNFTFDEFLQNGYMGKYPTIQDFEQHLSLYFTDARLKHYIEIRNHDSQKPRYIMCIPAFWKGIMYNENAKEEISAILKNYTFKDYETLRQTTPKQGLDCKFGKLHLKELAREIFRISYNSLKRTNEEHYLEPILELVEDGMTPADIIIKNFEGIWNGSIEKYINFSRI